MASQFYVSDITRFLREVLEADPSIEKSQREGRDIFWDHKVDIDMQKRQQQAEVPMKGYVYDTTPPEPGQSRLPDHASQ
jgi:hypothetical protein